MKNQLLVVLLCILGHSVVAQKKEIKLIEKALKKNDIATTVKFIEEYEGLFENAEKKYKNRFLIARVKAYGNMVKNDVQKFENIDKFIKAYKELPEESKKDVLVLKTELIQLIHKDGLKSYDAKEFKKASKSFEKLFRIHPQDTSSLYNTAQILISDKDNYPEALRIYLELKNLNYTGITTLYAAINVETNKVQYFSTKKERDFNVKIETYKDPTEEEVESKRPRIIKDLGFLYIKLGEKEKAIEIFNEARKETPNDVNIAINQANLYYELGDTEKFSKYMEDAVKLDPENADLHYNIGVINNNADKPKKAIESYKKVLELDPNHSSASLNLSSLYLEEGNKLIKQMDELTKKNKWNELDKLKAEKEKLYKKSVNVLEAYKKDNKPTNTMLEQLKRLYYSLGETEKFKEVKKTLEATK